MAKPMPTKVVTGKVRFSYAHVFTPTAVNEGEKEKYSVSIIISKDDEDTLRKVRAAIEAARQSGKAKWGGKIPKTLKMPLRDGDEERPDDEAYENSFFFNASTVRKPQIVDANVEPIIDPDEFYSGCYGRVSINFYAFNANGNKGVAAGLQNIQKLEDGDRLSGGSTAAEDFGTEIDDLF